MTEDTTLYSLVPWVRRRGWVLDYSTLLWYQNVNDLRMHKNVAHPQYSVQ